MKKTKIGLTVRKKYANYLISIISFAKTMKGSKSGRENIINCYYQIRSNKYSIACGKQRWQEIKITGWPGNKHDIETEKWKVSEKNVIYENLKRTNC